MIAIFTSLLTFILDETNIVFISILLTVVSLYALVDAYLKKWYLVLIFEFLIFELFIVMFVRNVIFGFSENSWRANYHFLDLNTESFKSIIISLLIIFIVHFLFGYNYRNKENLFSGRKSFPEINEQNSFLLIFNVFSLALLALFIVEGNILSMRNYAQTINTTYLPIFIMLFSMYLMMFFGSTKQLKVLNITSLVTFLYSIVFLYLILNGYRFLLVQIFTLIVLIYLKKKSVNSIKTALFLVIVGVGFYTILIYMKSAYLGNVEINNLLFGHERNLFYSLNAIQSNPYLFESNTYISTIQNLLPKALTGNDHLNVSATIMTLVNPSVYYSTGVTIGAFYLTEAFLSFGESGIFISSIGLVMFFLIVENKFKNHPALEYMYLFIGSQIFNFVYYGSLNYVKQILYFSILLFVLIVLKVLVFEKNDIILKEKNVK